MDATNNTVRITKAQKYDAAIALLEGKEPIIVPGKDGKNGVTMDANYLCDFFRAEKELLAKKNSPTSNKKLTKGQEKNETYKNVILAYLAEHPNKVVTATDVMETILRPAYPGELWSNQKTAALLNAMADKYDKDGHLEDDTGKLYKTPAKGKKNATFQIKPSIVAEIQNSGDTE